LSVVIGPGCKVFAVPQYASWMIEHAALGEPFECFVAEDSVVPVTYFKDVIRAMEMYFDSSEARNKAR